ncbi:hypothetical protein B0J12DRAFT_664498 [Macrophomina phaseolina]|uniref:Secreted protein n=1 Tax=Macrophomina phaseolina TaxID=35725 RepID=A0ABQ8GAC2_9PEZI|nr:hypothetical protein B0J12DRAFT_664498 [Macrophomina phaseolina]
MGNCVQWNPWLAGWLMLNVFSGIIVHTSCCGHENGGEGDLSAAGGDDVALGFGWSDCPSLAVADYSSSGGL